MHGHAASDAVSEHHEALDTQMFQHAGEAMHGFIFDESRRGWGSQAVGAAEAQPVIGDHCSAGGIGEGGWEVFPLFDTAERLVQQQDRGVVRAQRVALREPAADEHPAVAAVDPQIGRAVAEQGADGHGAFLERGGRHSCTVLLRKRQHARMNVSAMTPRLELTGCGDEKGVAVSSDGAGTRQWCVATPARLPARRNAACCRCESRGGCRGRYRPRRAYRRP